MTNPDVELEARLRRLVPAFKEGIEPPATLHAGMSSSRQQAPCRAHRSVLRELSLAAALIVFVGLLAFGFSRLRSFTPGPVKRSPSPSPVSGVIPWISTPAPSLKQQSPRIMWPDQAAQDVRQTVTEVHPVLLPAAIPAGFEAQVLDDAGWFSVVYVAADGRKISLSIVVPNPGAGSAHGQHSQPDFRRVRAEYQIDDATVLTSSRWLMWTEPGTALGGQPGVPYFLTTDGLSESDFWKIANSIGPIPGPVAHRACALSDLYAVSNGSSGATGHIVYGISLANHSSSPCTVSGYPGIALLTTSGSRVPLTAVHDPGGIVGTGRGDVPSGVLPANQPAPVPHQGGQNANVLFEWYYCGATPPAVTAIDLTIAGNASSRRVPLLNEGLAYGPSRCDDPSQGRRLLIGPIEPPAADQVVVTQGPTFEVSLTTPGTMRAGTTVDYQVTLTNVSSRPVSFDTCPYYQEGFDPYIASYQLNCRPIGRLEPGASVTFAMKFAIPLKPIGSTQKFLWTLHGFDSPASAVRVVTIQGP